MSYTDNFDNFLRLQALALASSCQYGVSRRRLSHVSMSMVASDT